MAKLLLSVNLSLQPAKRAGPWNWKGLTLSWVLPNSATWSVRRPQLRARPPDAPGAGQGVAKKARNRDDVFFWVKGPSGSLRKS